MDDILTLLKKGGTISIYSGPQPADPKDKPPGELLMSWTPTPAFPEFVITYLIPQGTC